MENVMTTGMWWLTAAFILGVTARLFRLPALIGFLAAGMLVEAFNIDHATMDELIEIVADLGVMLLLFTIGLKIKLNNILRPEILYTAGINMAGFTILAGGIVFVLSYTSLSLFSGLSILSCALIGFSLSFSSTVFVVKILEERGELSSFHGKNAIAILVIQDIFAVLFMTLVSDKNPSWWALTIPVYLWAVRYLLNYLLSKSGHGELLTIFGFFATFVTGAAVFELVGLKPDLGALVIGMLMVNHRKSDELYDRMMGYKDFFLISFFIYVGLMGKLNGNIVIATLIIFPLMFVKGTLFMSLFSRFKIRARTAYLTSLSLSNFSEFALITGLVGYKAGWLSMEWITVFAMLMTLSFLVSSPFNAKAHDIFDKYRNQLLRLNTGGMYIDEEPKSIGDAQYMIVGYGSIGRPAFHYLKDELDLKTIVIDYNHEVVKKYKNRGVNINWGDSSNSIFWDSIDLSHLRLVFLAMSSHESNLSILHEILKIPNRQFKLAAFCNYPDEAKKLKELHVDYVYDFKLYQGEDFAEQALIKFKKEPKVL
ncbi:MAG: cation:proton antiporter [Saprospiraceae bacterium]|nr:cation:proton antiporter [Saprospiraceae bacterium]